MLCLESIIAFKKYLFHLRIPIVHSSIPPPEMTQEIASRGIGLVYEMSPPSEREALVNLLVGTLMEGRKLATCYCINY